MFTEHYPYPAEPLVSSAFRAINSTVAVINDCIGCHGSVSSTISWLWRKDFVGDYSEFDSTFFVSFLLACLIFRLEVPSLLQTKRRGYWLSASTHSLNNNNKNLKEQKEKEKNLSIMQGHRFQSHLTSAHAEPFNLAHVRHQQQTAWLRYGRGPGQISK